MKDANLQSDIKLKQAVNQLKNVKANSLHSNANARLVYDDGLGLFYDDEKGIYVSKDGKESFNFPIIQLNNNEKVENITFNKNANNEYDIYLVKYDYTKEDVKNFSIEVLAEREVKYQALLKDGVVYPVEAQWFICVDTVTTTTYYEYHPGEGENGGDIIIACISVSASTGCIYGWDNSGGGDGGGGNGGNGGGGGDGTNPPYTNPPPTNANENPDGTIITAAVIDMENNYPPCPGDPVKSPKICPSSPGNPSGGTFGCTRNDPKKTCDGYVGKKKHAGVDIQGQVDDKIYNMYSGKIVDIRKIFGKTEYIKDSLGNYIVIESIINGQTVRIKYCHMGSVLFEIGNTIAQGMNIGTIGRSGNAGSPAVKTHLHIQSKVKDGSIWTDSNPINYLNTKYNNSNFDIESTCN